MVLINLIDIKDNIARYYYQPDKQGEKGIVAFNAATDEIVVERLAESDIKGSSFSVDPIRYRLKQEKDSLPQERLIMWY